MDWRAIRNAGTVAGPMAGTNAGRTRAATAPAPTATSVANDTLDIGSIDGVGSDKSGNVTGCRSVDTTSADAVAAVDASWDRSGEVTGCGSRSWSKVGWRAIGSAGTVAGPKADRTAAGGGVDIVRLVNKIY